MCSQEGNGTSTVPGQILGIQAGSGVVIDMIGQRIRAWEGADVSVRYMCPDLPAVFACLGQGQYPIHQVADQREVVRCLTPCLFLGIGLGLFITGNPSARQQISECGIGQVVSPPTTNSGVKIQHIGDVYIT